MKLQVAAFLSFLIMPYALADDQGGLKKDVAPPPPHAIEDGYRGTDDAEKMTIEQAKPCMMARPFRCAATLLIIKATIAMYFVINPARLT